MFLLISKFFQQTARFLQPNKTGGIFCDATSLILEIKSINHQRWIGPQPMQLVVVSAVRNAVSAATIIFTEISIRRDFFIIKSV